MRVRHRVVLTITKDADGKIKRFAPDDTLSEVVLDGFTKYTSGDFSVETEADELLSLGDITAVRGVYLEASADCTLEINGGDAITLRIGKDDALAKVFMEADITSLRVGNPSETTVLTGTYALWGDEAEE